MNEKDMVLDILNGLKANIISYTNTISQCGDLNVKQMFEEIRKETEKAYYDLYKIAEKKGYCIIPTKSTEQELQDLKTKLTQIVTAKNGAGPIPV